MTKSWLDLLTVALCAAVLFIAVFDFFLGKAGRLKLQSRLESLWLRFSYVRWPSLGATEAVAFLSWIDRVFGARFLSWRRLISSTLFVVVLICIAYVVYEGVRVIAGKPLRWPFLPPHWETGFPVQVLPAMASISLTRFMVTGCVRLLAFLRGGTVLFVLAVGVAGYLSSAAAFAIAFCFDALVFAAQFLLAAVYHYIVTFGDASGVSNFAQTFPLLWSRIMIGLSLAWVAIHDPLGAWWTLVSITQHNDHGLVRAWYDFCISTGFGGLRLGFAVAFIGTWLCLAPLKWVTSTVLLRLAEAERGALTALAAGIALLTKLIQEYLKIFSG